MESCREKIIGKGQVANLIKIVQLFELRCSTACEDAPCNPIQIMFSLKRHHSYPLWQQYKLRAFRLVQQDALATVTSLCWVGWLTCPHVFVFPYTLIGNLDNIACCPVLSNVPLQSLSLCSIQMAPKIPEWYLVLRERTH